MTSKFHICNLKINLLILTYLSIINLLLIGSNVEVNLDKILVHLYKPTQGFKSTGLDKAQTFTKPNTSIKEIIVISI